jgi:protein TIF31
MGFPMEHPHKLCCLRQELVDAFVESRYMTFIKLAAYHLQTYGLKRQITPGNVTSKQDDENEKSAENVSKDSETPTMSPETKVKDESQKEEVSNKKIVESITSSPEKSEGK